ncbi:MAG TPA: flavodoxin family protein [Bacillota bacterium]
MRVLLLNGSRTVQHDPTTELISKICRQELEKNGHLFKEIRLAEKKIAPCLGCFGCWVKTPGVCVIPDEGREIAASVIRSNLLINLTSITFGGYSSELKKAMDRLIPLLSPFFMKIKGEVHHQTRYKSYPKLLNIGVLPENDPKMAELFRTLGERNAINLHSPLYRCGIYLNTQEPEAISNNLVQLLKEVGA